MISDFGEANIKINKLIDRIKERTLDSPRELADETFEAFQFMIKNIQWDYRDELTELVCKNIHQISAHCRPHAIVAENIGLRILKIICNIFHNTIPDTTEYDGDLLNLLLNSRVVQNDNIQSISSVKQPPEDNISSYMEMIQEELEVFKIELDTSSDDISQQSLQYIHSNETIMVYGYSHTIEMFLKYAARKRKFRVIVCQASPEKIGHLMVQRLSNIANIEISLIPDSCIFAMMARVNKVILSCYSISADGSLCSQSGSHALALSASDYGLPILVCTGLYKLSPTYHLTSSVCGREIDHTFLKSPELILDFYTASTLGPVEVLNPSFDFVPADLVTLFITNKGALTPSYMYRLLKEMYSVDQPNY